MRHLIRHVEYLSRRLRLLYIFIPYILVYLDLCLCPPIFYLLRSLVPYPLE